MAVTLGEGAGTGVTLPCAPGSWGNSLFLGAPGSCDTSGKALRFWEGLWWLRTGGFSLPQRSGCDRLGLGSSAAALSLGGVAGGPLSCGIGLEGGDPDILGFPEGATAFSRAKRAPTWCEHGNGADWSHPSSLIPSQLSSDPGGAGRAGAVRFGEEEGDRRSSQPCTARVELESHWECQL